MHLQLILGTRNVVADVPLHRYNLRVRQYEGLILRRTLLPVGTAGLPGLPRRGRRQDILLVARDHLALRADGGLVVAANLLQRRALLGADSLRGGDRPAQRGAGRRGGLRLREPLLHAVLEPPLAEDVLVEVQPVLLRADHHARAHEAHKGDDLVARESVAVDEVRADEAAGAAESGLAVHGDGLVLDGNHVVGQPDELAHHGEGGAGAVVEYHVEMLDAVDCEECGGVQRVVQTDYETNVALGEM